MNKLLSLSLAASLTTICVAGEMKNPLPLGPVHGSNGMVFPKGKFNTNLKSIFFTKDNAYDGDDKINDPKQREMQVARHNFIVRYGLGSRFDVRMVVPFFDKSMDMRHPPSGATGDFDNSGIGDVRLITRYSLASPKRGDSFFAALGVGVELPTGDTKKNFRLNNGMTLPFHQPDGLQLGDGSVDPILEFGFTKPLPKSRIDAYAMYVFNTEGDNDFERGDQFKYDIGYSYMLHPRFMPSVEINGMNKGKNKKNGSKVAGSGGHEVFITPGFSSKITKNLQVFAGVGFPIYRDLDKGTLGADTRVTTKISYCW